jgi:hypothetical protein
MKRAALYVSIPDGEVRWQIKRAALEQRRTVRALVLDILIEWLRRHGYSSPSVPGEVGGTSIAREG